MSTSAQTSNAKPATDAQTIEISVKGKWFHVPALNVDGRALIVKGKWLKTAIIDAEEWLETDLEDPEQCIRKLKAQRSGPLHADIFTFTQKPSVTVPQFKYHTELDSVAVARTTDFNGWWESLPQECRKNVRRAQKRGVEVRVRELDDTLIREIMGVNDDAPTRQGKLYTHYGKTFDEVTKDQASFPGRSEYICGYCGDEMIGFIKLIYRGEVASILQILTKPSHADKRPSNALIAKTVELCQQKGVSYLTYGLFNYGNKRDSSLREFKIRNGFEEVLVPRFYVPLTGKGAIGIRLKVHRGLIGLLPHGTITALVNVRTRWYKFITSRCSSKVELPNSNR